MTVSGEILRAPHAASYRLLHHEGVFTDWYKLLLPARQLPR